MILIITNSKDATADYLCSRLTSANILFFRFDTDIDLTEAKISYSNSSEITLTVRNTCLIPSRIKHVWFRRPSLGNHQRNNISPEEAHTLEEHREAIEGFFSQIPLSRWINHPSRNALASHKIEQLTFAANIGFLVPDTIVTQDPLLAKTFWKKHNKQIITKPLASGYIERDNPNDDTVIYTSLVNDKSIEFLDDIKYCPTLLQQKISIKRDVRITILDNSLVAVGLESPSKSQIDIRRDNMIGVKYSIIKLPTELECLLFEFIRHYELRFSAVDFAEDESGNWYFLENNPNGQWAWMDISAHQEIFKLFLKSFSSDNGLGV
jgi:hypothetical protein